MTTFERDGEFHVVICPWCNGKINYCAPSAEPGSAAMRAARAPERIWIDRAIEATAESEDPWVANAHGFGTEYIRADCARELPDADAVRRLVEAAEWYIKRDTSAARNALRRAIAAVKEGSDGVA